MDTRRVRRPFKVDLALRPEDRPEYEALLADPRASGGDALAWLVARGYALTRVSVYRHRRHFLRGLDDVRHWAGVARHVAEAARAHGPGVLADGALTQLEHLLVRTLHAMTAAGDTPDPRQFAQLAAALAKAVETRGVLDEQNRAAAERTRAAGRNRRSPQAANRLLVRKVGHILGLGPMPGEEPYREGEEFEDA